jgi:glucosamine kinase
MTEHSVERESLMPLPPTLLGGPPAPSVTHMLGLDGGATKTLAVALDLADYRTWLGHSGPSNADAVGDEAAVAAILGATETALDAAGVPAERAAAVIASAGTTPPTLEAEVAAAFGFEVVHVVNDVVAAWALGTVCSPGVAVIAGTGSHVFGVAEDRRTWRVGGWGHALGDEGSAFWLGLEGLKAALKDRDGSGPRTTLLDAALETYPLRAIDDLPELYYGKPLTKAEVAAFATHVAAAAEAGDEVSRRLFEQAGVDLAEQVRAAVDALGLAGGALVVALIGSVFHAGPLIRGSFEQAVLGFAPEARFNVPELPPVAGALMLAQQSIGAWESFDYERLAAALQQPSAERAPVA